MKGVLQGRGAAAGDEGYEGMKGVKGVLQERGGAAAHGMKDVT